MSGRTCTVWGKDYYAQSDKGLLCKGCAAEEDKCASKLTLCGNLPDCGRIIWVEVVPDTPLQQYHAALEQDIG